MFSVHECSLYLSQGRKYYFHGTFMFYIHPDSEAKKHCNFHLQPLQTKYEKMFTYYLGSPLIIPLLHDQFCMVTYIAYAFPPVQNDGVHKEAAS